LRRRLRKSGRLSSGRELLLHRLLLEGGLLLLRHKGLLLELLGLLLELLWLLLELLLGGGLALDGTAVGAPEDVVKSSRDAGEEASLLHK
jgi:hypothetical protein